MSNKLREMGYTSEDGRTITCHRAGPRGLENRYSHEHSGIIRIDLERDTKSTRELVERLIAAADESRALVGRSRNGSAVLLFRVGEHSDLPYVADDGISKLITRDGELFSITYGSVDQTVNVNAWSWMKGRSPFDVPHDSLAVLFKDIGQRCVDAAFNLGCAHAPTAAERDTAQRVANIKRGLEDGTFKPRNLQAESDERLVAAHRDIGPFDSMWTAIQNARQRIFERSSAG